MFFYYYFFQLDCIIGKPNPKQSRSTNMAAPKHRNFITEIKVFIFFGEILHHIQVGNGQLGKTHQNGEVVTFEKKICKKKETPKCYE